MVGSPGFQLHSLNEKIQYVFEQHRRQGGSGRSALLVWDIQTALKRMFPEQELPPAEVILECVQSNENFRITGKRISLEEHATAISDRIETDGTPFETQDLTDDEFEQIVDLYPVPIHEHQPDIQKLARSLGRRTRVIEAQLIMCRNFDKGASWGNANQRLKAIWDSRSGSNIKQSEMGYDDWADAIGLHLQTTWTSGETAFLLVTESVLHQIYGSNNDSADVCAVSRLRDVVRDRFIQGATLFRKWHGETENGTPRSLPFLCAMIIAANRQGSDEDLTPTTYFRYFNEFMGVDQADRLDGFEPGSEMTAWLSLSRWIQNLGLTSSIPSEANDDDGAWKYVNIILDQVLVRTWDEERITSKLNTLDDKDLVLSDREVFASFLLAENWTNHANKILDPSANQNKREAFIDDAYERCLQAISESGDSATTQSRSQFGIQLEMQSGTVSLKPLISSHPQLGSTDELYVRTQNQLVAAEIDDLYPRWLKALGVAQFSPDDGFSGAIEAPDLDLRLEINAEARSYWVLTPHRSKPNIWGTWRQRPRLGEKFILLAKGKMQEWIQTLRSQELIEYEDSSIMQVADAEHWRCFVDCTHTGNSWHGVFPPNAEAERLTALLKPSSNFNLQLVGGVRGPGLAYLAEYPPQAAVASATDQNVVLNIQSLSDPKSNHPIHTSSNRCVDIPRLPAGDYVLELRKDAKCIERQRLTLVDIEGIMPALGCDPVTTLMGGAS